MYKLSDTQIDFILNDISARGVEMEDLQHSLLDHVCCIIEQNLEENGDFEGFYHSTIKTFYKNHLWEIEEETISLLTFKNYYAMKKSMLISGTVAVSFLTIGIFFKFMHWPGANISIVLGIGLLSLVFLPLMFILKIKEKENLKDKLIIASGALSGVLITMGILFKLQHWPYANIMINTSMFVMLFLFLPFYFFSGIRKPEAKVNTIVSSIILVAICGLMLALVRTPRSSHLRDKMMTETYLKNQTILQNELMNFTKTEGDAEAKMLSKQIINQCEELKTKLIELNTESKSIANDYRTKGVVIGDHFVDDAFNNTEVIELTQNLINSAGQYGLNSVGDNLLNDSFLSYYKKRQLSGISAFEVLQQLTQMQLLIIQNQRGLLASRTK